MSHQSHLTWFDNLRIFGEDLNLMQQTVVIYLCITDIKAPMTGIAVQTFSILTLGGRNKCKAFPVPEHLLAEKKTVCY
jgi:hypothetical protein